MRQIFEWYVGDEDVTDENGERVSNGVGMRLIAQRLAAGEHPDAHGQAVVNGDGVNNPEESRLRRHLHALRFPSVWQPRADNQPIVVPSCAGRIDGKATAAKVVEI